MVCLVSKSRQPLGALPGFSPPQAFARFVILCRALAACRWVVVFQFLVLVGVWHCASWGHHEVGRVAIVAYLAIAAVFVMVGAHSPASASCPPPPCAESSLSWHALWCPPPCTTGLHAA